MSPYGQQTSAVDPVAFSQPNWEQIININWAQRLDYINYKIWTIENALSSRELNGRNFPSTRVEELLQLLGRWLSKGYHDASRSSGCCCWTRGAVGLQGVTVDSSFVHRRNLHGNQESTKSQWKKYTIYQQTQANCKQLIILSRVFGFYIFALAEIHATRTDKDTIFVHYRLVRRTIEYTKKRQNSMLKSTIYLYLLQWMMLPSSKK